DGQEAAGRPSVRKGGEMISSNMVSCLVLGLAGVALASNVHLKGRSGPAFTDQGLVLNASASLTGLGQGDVLVVLSAGANPTSNCCTPGGSCKVPGQNPAPISVTGSESIPAGEVKNGNVTFSV